MLLSIDPGIKNLGYVLMLKSGAIIDSSVIKIPGNNNIKIMENLLKFVVMYLKKITLKIAPNLKEIENLIIEDIIIEAQPKKNSKSKMIETSLTSIFIFLKFWSNIKILNRESKITIISPRKKLQFDPIDYIPENSIIECTTKEELWKTFGSLKGKSGYYNRKKAVQKIVTMIYGKKFSFDVSDSILQACFVLEKYKTLKNPLKIFQAKINK